MLLNSLQNQENFTRSEKTIAEYILKNPFQVVFLTAEQLGKVTFTSKASVLRLCKKMGDLNYLEFIRQVDREAREKSYLLELLDAEPISTKTSARELMDLVPTIMDSAISSTKLVLSPTILQRVVNRLKKVDQIDLYGVGILEAVVDAAVFKFQSLGLNASKHTNINEHAILSNDKKKRQVAILISFTGRNEMMLAAARFLQENGIYTVGIGGLEHLDLKEVCTEYLPIDAENYLLTMEAVAPFASASYVLDLLYAGLVVADYERQVSIAKKVIEKSRYRGS